ncbi:MAG: hypothetical protein GX447_09340 [Elusimicrobia bacterium]|nr:hypothetical protein [Elusimicrobiota bacterium]
MRKIIFYFLSFLFICRPIFCAETEVQLDAYYSAAGIYIPLSGKEIEKLGKKSESEIYSYLIKNIHKPKTLVLEASFNPLPYAGTIIKRSWREFYDKAQITENFNYVSAATAGFEEPWAVSLFLGNVAEFESKKKKIEGKRKGYSGILFDAGDYHIKDNTLIYDKWLQGEFKLKGEYITPERTLSYSYRAGIKIHDNPYIKDSFFIGIRRSRTDFERKKVWYENCGLDFSSHFSLKNAQALRHYLILEKKFPYGKKYAFSLGAGFVWDSQNKYGNFSGKDKRSSFQFILRPNLEF